MMHPVIKELRETHKRIVSMWAEIGLDYNKVEDGIKRTEPDLKKGDRTLYRRLMASKLRERNK